MIPDDQIVDLKSLIARLNALPVMSSEERSRKNKARQFNFFTTHTRADYVAHVERSRPTFLDFIAASGGWVAVHGHDQDLSWQIQIINGMIDDWLRLAEQPAPHYPLRVAVLLRKAKLVGLEAAFLTSYLRHFGGVPGKTQAKLDERLAKFGGGGA